MPDDTLIYFGGPVKALGKGRVGGYLVTFSKEDGTEKDLAGEYFTAKTYLGPADGNGAEALFDHGFPVPAESFHKEGKTLTKAEKEYLAALSELTFAPLKTKRDLVGIWAETVLNLADDYEKRVYSLAKSGKLGWSSGTAGHRVKRTRDGEILSWPILEGSLTPCPCEPRNKAMTMKSLSEMKFVDLDGEVEDEPEVKTLPPASLAAKLTRFITDLTDDGRSRDDIVKSLAREAGMDSADVEKVLSGEFKRPSNAKLKAFARVLDLSAEMLIQHADGIASQTIKGMFENALAETPLNRWQLDSLYCSVVKKIAAAASASALAGAELDWQAMVVEVTDELSARLKTLVVSQIDEYLISGSDESFYLKAIGDPSEEDFISAKNVDIADHRSLVVSALRSFITRAELNQDARVKIGRVLSDKNRTEVMTALDDIVAGCSRLQKVIEASKPKATSAEMRKAQANSLRLKMERRQHLGA